MKTILSPLPFLLIIACIACIAGAEDSAKPPEGATVLFDGKDTSAWVTKAGKPCPWKVEDGYMQVGGGDIVTTKKYGDCKLHVEFWIAKYPPEITGQARGNSGVKLQGRYEIQILDSFGKTPDKQDCAAVYLQKPPDKNMCTEPETWQTYDITFREARYDEAGKKKENARVTVIHNGTKVQDDVEILGKTGASDPEAPGPAPLLLQDHHGKVRFRNVWIVDEAKK